MLGYYTVECCAFPMWCYYVEEEKLRCDTSAHDVDFTKRIMGFTSFRGQEDYYILKKSADRITFGKGFGTQI